MQSNTADILDLGFNWKDLTAAGGPPTDQENPSTMSYGFMSSTSSGNVGAGQEALHLVKDRYFGFSFFELSLTPGISLDEVTIDIAPASPFDSSFPVSPIPGGVRSTFSSIRTDGIGASRGLNAKGYHFKLPAPTHYKLVNEGTYQFTVKIKASLNGGQPSYWEVDPEIQVGTGGGTGRGQS